MQQPSQARPSRLTGNLAGADWITTATKSGLAEGGKYRRCHRCRQPSIELDILDNLDGVQPLEDCEGSFSLCQVS
jgi:hypothetical protein